MSIKSLPTQAFGTNSVAKNSSVKKGSNDYKTNNVAEYFKTNNI